MSIFVSLAAFCEPLLEFTLDGLFAKAEKPDEVFVGLVDQTFDVNREWLSAKPYWPNIRYVQINPIDARGVSWARSIAFSLYQGETYLLQIDSHTHFASAWDQRLIAGLEHLRAVVQRPILTTYPPPFEFDDNNQPFPTLTPAGSVYGLKKHPETDLTENCATLRFRVEHLRGAEYCEGFHVGAGFLFALGQFVEEVPYDPYLYFHGEEQSLALRAYTRGWTIFHPMHDHIPIYHLYKQKDNEYRTHHWHAEYEAQRKIKWTTLKARADVRLLDLVSGRLHGAYGLGTIRTLAEFVRISGIDYSQYQRNAGEPRPSVDPPEN